MPLVHRISKEAVKQAVEAHLVLAKAVIVTSLDIKAWQRS